MGRHRIAVAAGLLPLILVLAACSGAATTTPASQAASQAAPPSTAASTAPSTTTSEAPSAATTGATVEAKTVGALGTKLVAGSNGMTVYTFTKDVKDSGKSNCSGGCATTWPPLTVTGTPTAGAGVTGKLATITRDDGTTQVTYNGLPLYFFSGDTAPGDGKGVYTNWEAVAP